MTNLSMQGGQRVSFGLSIYEASVVKSSGTVFRQRSPALARGRPRRGLGASGIFGSGLAAVRRVALLNVHAALEAMVKTPHVDCMLQSSHATSFEVLGTPMKLSEMI